ncbi:MAG: putative ABC transporter permease [Clostridia bacterium]|nr:putative ABC transporter permease [Clostridia bacterium]
MGRIRLNLHIFCIGAAGYSLMEIVWRGFTHWSMALTGGICFLVLYHLYGVFSHLAMWKKCFIGSAVITAIEFAAGCIVNLYLHWDVWDYSEYPFDLYGQICLFYSVLWFFLSALIVFLADYIRGRKILGGRK